MSHRSLGISEQFFATQAINRTSKPSNSRWVLQESVPPDFSVSEIPRLRRICHRGMLAQ